MSTDPETWNEDNTEVRNPVELVADEFASSVRKGESPSIEEYVKRLPHREEEVRAVLQSILMMERVSGHERERLSQLRKTSRFSQKQPESLGDFRILKEIGRGGMGIIYEAEQVSLKRKVALKVLGPGIADSPKQLDRFRRESEAIARLHHTNIVPVFGIGEENGIHFFAMHLIEGGPLNHVDPLPVGLIAKIGVQAASALQYAHEHGVLHRDVKPSNLLLDKEQNIWVTDFGLAKLSEMGDLTQAGDIVGTLRYMAPEQLEGRSDARTDVYGLGLTLYELLAHQPAFSDSQTLSQRLKHPDVQSVRKWNADVPRDLETIVMKATARDPSARYASAGDLAYDLQQFLEDRPITARRVSMVEKGMRWCRRNPAIAASTSLAAFLLFVTAFLSTLGYYRTSDLLKKANQATEVAKQASKEAAIAQGNAETNLSVAMGAFDSIFDHIANRGVPQSLDLAIDESNSIAYQTSLTEADAELLRSLLGFYAKFAASQQTDSALLAKTAAAHFRIGQIHQRLGHQAEAVDALNESIAIYASLLETEPMREDFVVSMSRGWNELGVVESMQARPPNEIAKYHWKAIQFLDRQPASMLAKAPVRFELARSLDLAGSVMIRQGFRTAMNGPPIGLDGPRRSGPDPNRPDPNRPAFGNRSEKDGEFRGFPPDGQGPSDDRRPRGPGGFLRQLGENFMAGPEGGFSNIESELMRSRALLEELCREDTENETYALALAQVERHIYSHSLISRKGNSEKESLRKATDILERLVEKHPDKPQYLLELADTLSSSSMQKGEGFDVAIREDLTRANHYCEQLVQKFPNAKEYQALLARVHSSLAALEQRERHWVEMEKTPSTIA